jgi:hypothetical protein
MWSQFDKCTEVDLELSVICVRVDRFPDGLTIQIEPEFVGRVNLQCQCAIATIVTARMHSLIYFDENSEE